MLGFDSELEEKFLTPTKPAYVWAFLTIAPQVEKRNRKRWRHLIEIAYDFYGRPDKSHS